MTITKVMLLGFYILINVVSQNALKTSMCLCSHYSSKWQQKNVQNVDSAKMRDFSHISKKEFFHFFFAIFNFYYCDYYWGQKWFENRITQNT